jgi:hypothetical protein
MYQVVLSTEDDCNVVDQPLSVDPHELVAERVGLDLTHKLLDIVGAIQAVDGPDVHLVVLVHGDLPQLHIVCEHTEKEPYRNDQATGGPNVEKQKRVSEGVVAIAYHSSEAKVQEEDTPGGQADDVVVLG